ncbi:hypothetical protein UP09_30955 [Bradyrhizobium sp. LTSP885]|uniref:hypothetical protein n=1 Tax=Bradyrhizobium sp. LTSP885 TaxID=1619232 RepID=UPI0005CA3B19|nr:hypothetical protein [Bradyrhizobium sp. LTSP885]KJC35645.1 hypothetical protein UP09_30955 [Bradyrhizobium sp. LTSP885]
MSDDLEPDGTSIGGQAFEQVMHELGYPRWYRDDRITKAIDTAWQVCRDTGRTAFDIAAAVRTIGLPPMPQGQWH